MNVISYSESHFLLCAHTAPTILVSLVPVPWLYTFFSASDTHIHISVILGLYFLATILVSSNLKYSKQNFGLLSFQFSSPPRFLHLGKWYYLLPNLSQHNTWNHLGYSLYLILIGSILLVFL